MCSRPRPNGARRPSRLPFRTPLLAGALSVAAAALAPGAARAYCPSYTASSAYNQHECAIEAAPGQNPTPAEWAPIFDLVSQGPSAWGDMGPSVPDIGQGCGKPEPLHSVPARFPCELLKAIAAQESGWRQFCVPDLPADQVGGASRTIISFDCGYGIGQVTSGMHVGEDPGFDRERVAADPVYNLATGTRILASKWIATQCVGDNQPSIIEHWYIATWAYNGLAYVNNPNNPNYDPNRGVWNPAAGGGAPYQEKVFGWMEHPAFDGWSPAEPAYPNPGDIGGGSSPPELPDPDCASPTDCAATRPLHPTSCDGQSAGGAGGQGGATPTGGAGGQGTTSPGGAGGDTGPDGGTSPAGVGGSGGGEGGGGDDENTGCACHTSTGSPTGGSLAAALALASLAARRRRRRGERTP